MGLWGEIKSAGRKLESGVRNIGRKFDTYVLQPTIDLVEDTADNIGELIFGTETIYSTSVTVSPILDEVPDVYKHTVLSAVLNNINRSGALAEANMYNVTGQVQKIYDYCQTTYTNGLPSGTYNSLIPDTAAVNLVLKNHFNPNAQVKECFLDYLDPNFYVELYLKENTDYDSKTGKLTTHGFLLPSGSPLTEPVYLHSADFIQTPDGKFYLRAYFFYYTDVANNQATTAVTDYPITLDPRKLYYQAEWTAVATPAPAVNPFYSPGEIRAKKEEYWTAATYEYPEYSGEYTTDVNKAYKDLFVWSQSRGITARQLAKAIRWSEESVQLKSAELGLGSYIEVLPESPDYYFVYDPTTGTYPEIPQVTSNSYVSPFLPIIGIKVNDVNVNSDKNSDLYKTTKEAMNKFSLDLDAITKSIDDKSANSDAELVNDAFFGFMINAAPKKQGSIAYLMDFFTDLAVLSTSTNADWHAWKERGKTGTLPLNTFDVSEGSFNIKVGWNYIDTVTYAGSIGSIGLKTVTVTQNESESFGGGEDEDGNPRPTYYVSRDVVTYREQVSATIVREVAVNGLVCSTDVQGKGTNKYTLRDGKVLIPVSSKVLNDLVPFDGIDVCYESCAIVVYALDSKELEWYQTSAFIGAFKVAIWFVAIVMALPSGGQSITAAQALIAIAEAYAANYLIKLAVEEIAYHFGGDVAMALAVIVAIVAFSYGDMEFASEWIPDPSTILNMSLKSIDAIGQLKQEETADLLKEVEQKGEMYQSEAEKLQEAYDSLDTSGDYNYFDIKKVGAYIDVNESPTDFVNRTVTKSVNIGTNVDIIHNYVDIALQPIKINFE